MKRYQLVAAAAVVAVLFAGKHYYSVASAGELAFVLAPTAKLVGLLTGHTFAYEAGTGWVSHEAAFIIAPACAGLNFALAAFLALMLGWWRELVTPRAVAVRLALAVVAAYLTTLVVNSVRISIAVETHQGAELHRIAGVVVYVVGLCALYAVAQAIGRNSHALGRS